MAPRLLRSGFLAYWLTFVLLTFRQGQYPGLIAHPEQWQYPYGAVVAVCSLFALLLAILYSILSPTSFPYSWRRLVAALLFSAALFLMGIASVATDQPGYYYVPALFGLATIASVLALGLVSIICALRGGSARAA